MLKLRHELRPRFGAGDGVDYHLLYRPMSTDLVQEVRDRAEALRKENSDFALAEKRQMVADHVLDAVGLVNEEGEKVPGAEALKELMAYPGFVNEVFVQIFAGSVVSDEEDPTSGP